MPRITVSIEAPDYNLEQDLVTVDLPPGSTVAGLKSAVSVETNLPQSSLQFHLNGTPIQGDDKTLEEAGVNDGDMLAMWMRQPAGGNAAAVRQIQQRNQPAGAPPGTQDPETVRRSLLANPSAMNEIRQSRPELAEAVHDSNRFREVFNRMIRDQEAMNQERMEQMRQLEEDPFNIESQSKIEDMIRQQSVQENLQFALEHSPEFFGRVTMLYIPVAVNKHPVKAFVDSGAQTTIMSPSCADSCGIMRLIDRRFSGIAKGVGTAQILGRVHSAPIQIGNSTMSCSFTVMEGKDVDLLLGLDMLKRFQAVIDLKQNKLTFGDGNEVSFLGEADIPKSFEEAMQNEPTVAGPGGTEIGAQSGTVRPAGTSSAAASSSSRPNGAFQGSGRTLGHPSTSTPGQTSSTTAPASAQSQGAHPKEKIDQLVSLGFGREEAISALNACGGNVEYAAGLLFQG